MSASADGPNLTCGKCGAPLQRVGKCTDQCVACLLELASDEEEISDANAERFDHYQVAIHTEGRPIELGRGAMGVTFKAFDTVLGNEVALKVIDARVAAHHEARARFLREARAAASFGTRTSPPFFITGRARVMVNAFTRWSWSRAKRWKRACDGADHCRRFLP
jgi:hypothetical protein